MLSCHIFEDLFHGDVVDGLRFCLADSVKVFWPDFVQAHW